jgi:hypothetical protein
VKAGVIGLGEDSLAGLTAREGLRRVWVEYMSGGVVGSGLI